MPKQELSPKANPEARIQQLVDRLMVREEIQSFDSHGNYDICLSQESLDSAAAAKRSLWNLGTSHPELIGCIVERLVKKELPSDEVHSKVLWTENGFQMVPPESVDKHGWSWISGLQSRQMIEDAIIGFGLAALSQLQCQESKQYKHLITIIKMQAFQQKLKDVLPEIVQVVRGKNKE